MGENILGSPVGIGFGGLGAAMAEQGQNAMARLNLNSK